VPVEQHQAFLGRRFWPQLDGLRVVSIAIVLVAHMGDQWLPVFKGALGVTVFFVISGYLITSLLIREEHRNQQVSLSQFYLRRVFRIVPLYMLALATATGLVFAGFGDDKSTWLSRLPLLATFNGDLAGGGTFVLSWSIGIEEKFYILWPLLGFSLLTLRKHRLWTATGLLLICIIAAFIPAVSYLGTYTAILAGCVLAMLAHDSSGFRVVAALARPIPANLLLALAVVMFAVDIYLPWTEATGYAHVLFALAVVLAFPGLLIGQGWLAKAMSWRPLAFVGTRTYGIYLFHAFCIDVISRLLIPSGQTNPAIGIGRLIIAFALSFAVADVLHRLVEQPAIRLGRRLTGRGLPPGEVPQVSSSAAASPTSR
jgi:peptidoglycan/LPS O-acetylase OafA/YrhL